VGEKRDREVRGKDKLAHERMNLGIAITRQPRRETPSEYMTEGSMTMQRNSK